MTPTDRARLAEIREREKAATPGPWHYENGTVWGGGAYIVSHSQVIDKTTSVVFFESNPDAELCAHIRNETPWLLELAGRHVAPRSWRSVAEAPDGVWIEMAEPDFGERAIGKFDKGEIEMPGSDVLATREALAEGGWIFTEVVDDLPEGFGEGQESDEDDEPRELTDYEKKELGKRMAHLDRLTEAVKASSPLFNELTRKR